MDGHANPQGDGRVPLLGQERVLGAEGRDQGVRSRRECSAQPVAGVGEDAAPAVVHGPPQQLVMAGQVLRHGVLVPFPTPGARFDVGEQEDDRVFRPAGARCPSLASGSPPGAWRLCPVKLWGLLEDLLLQLAERGGGFETELVAQGPPDPLIGPERIGLAAQAVEGDHELAPGPFPQRVIGHMGFEADQSLRRSTQSQFGLGQLLDRSKANLFQPTGLQSGEPPVGEVGQGRTAPEVECLLQRGHGSLGLTAAEGVPAPGEQILETVGVDQAGVTLEHIARLPAPEAQRSLVRADLGQTPAQPRDQGLGAGAGAGQAPFTPEFLDEHVERYDPVEVKDEHGQEGPLLGAADLEHPSARSDLEGAEQADVDSVSLPARGHRSPLSRFATAAAYDGGTWAGRGRVGPRMRSASPAYGPSRILAWQRTRTKERRCLQRRPWPRLEQPWKRLPGRPLPSSAPSPTCTRPSRAPHGRCGRPPFTW